MLVPQPVVMREDGSHRLTDLIINMTGLGGRMVLNQRCFYIKNHKRDGRMPGRYGVLTLSKMPIAGKCLLESQHVPAPV